MCPRLQCSIRGTRSCRTGAGAGGHDFRSEWSRSDEGQGFSPVSESWNADIGGIRYGARTGDRERERAISRSWRPGPPSGRGRSLSAVRRRPNSLTCGRTGMTVSNSAGSLRRYVRAQAEAGAGMGVERDRPSARGRSRLVRAQGDGRGRRHGRAPPSVRVSGQSQRRRRCSRAGLLPRPGAQVSPVSVP